MKNIVPFPAARPVSPSRSFRAAAVRSIEHFRPRGSAKDDAHALLSPSTPTNQQAGRGTDLFAWFHIGTLVVLFLMLYMALAGCGGGYPGASLSNVTAAAATIDAGQAVNVSATASANLPITWTVSGPGCSGTSCGSISATGSSGVFTAPTGVTSPMQVTIVAAVTGTSDTRTTTVTVNPDPAISGALPTGIVGVPYTATLHGSGGTGTLSLSIASGSLPAGLTFNASSGVISGTPTSAVTANFKAQVTDSAPMPFLATASESITIAVAGAPLTLLSGTPPIGVVGIPYTTLLTAAGGVAPYTFSLTSGSLPAGLTLASGTGVISGTPTAAGTVTFTAQV